jgi:hypothetical protein
MEVISSHAPCALSLVVFTGNYDEQNMGTQIIGTGMKDVSFKLTREALKAKQKQLKQQGKGHKQKRTCL